MVEIDSILRTLPPQRDIQGVLKSFAMSFYIMTNF
jgi:hypothetical protein